MKTDCGKATRYNYTASHPRRLIFTVIVLRTLNIAYIRGLVLPTDIAALHHTLPSFGYLGDFQLNLT